MRHGATAPLVVAAMAVVCAQFAARASDLSLLHEPPWSALTLRRATAQSLLVEVPCEPSCGAANVKLKIKKSINSSWELPTNVAILPLHKDIYRINQLQPDTLYYLRARMNIPRKNTSVLEARTCPERPPPAPGLRVARAGPGWLDVRWRPPRERCASHLQYATRYRAEGAAFGARRTYGTLPARRAGFARLGPAHPCAAWPAEFCLLLADDVQPGKNHTVELQVQRLDGTDEERAPVQSVVALADARPPSAAAPYPHEDLMGDLADARSVNQWFVVSVVVVLLFSLFAAFVLVGLRRMLSSERGGTEESVALSEQNAQLATRHSPGTCDSEPLQWCQPPPRYEDVVHLVPSSISAPHGTRENV